MTSIMDILPANTLDLALLVLKLMYLLAIGLYVAFAILIVRQISLMTGTLISSISASIKLEIVIDIQWQKIKPRQLSPNE